MTNLPISVIIISHQNPAYLRLCLFSLYRHQDMVHHQVIVVLDGPNDESERMIQDQFPGVDLVAFPENKGQSIAHNTGVALAEHPYVLIVNDDNIFPPHWDTLLWATGTPTKTIIAPNQMEPRPSIFPSFVIRDFGITADTFDLAAYAQYVDNPEKFHGQSADGQTWPVFMEKKWYMILGGLDVSFPSPSVADWDFFLRAELAGLLFIRNLHTVFYHFASAQMKATPERTFLNQQKEQQSYEYFAWKWGYFPVRNALNSALPLSHTAMRGITF